MTDRSASLPENPNLEWLRKTAKDRLDEMRTGDTKAKLAAAQFDVARQYGFASWRGLKAHVHSLTVDGQFKEAVSQGDLPRLKSLLDQHPDKLQARFAPYKWSLLHGAAQAGQLAVVEYLLQRGLDPNYREEGDNTSPMHWAAAGGHLEVVKRLADAGGDVIGEGDDHMGGVIGWASCWQGCDDAAHRAVVDFLISQGARHHIFSAIALNLENEVRRIVAADPGALNQRQSRNENHRTPLHFAVHMKRPAMVELLLELGADPLAVDGDGFSAAMYANNTSTDLRLMEKVRELTASEMVSADRGQRAPRITMLDLVAVLSLGDWETAAKLLRDGAKIINKDGPAAGTLHVLAKRGDARAVRWLLGRGADPNARWGHWDAELTPLHLAAAQGHAEVVRLLLGAGADPSIRDSKHDGDAAGWAQYGSNPQAPNWREIVEILEASHPSKRG